MNPEMNKSVHQAYWCYDAAYYDIYAPSYGIAFVFYDEDELDYESVDWNDFIVPMPSGQSARQFQHQRMLKQNTSGHHH